MQDEILLRIGYLLSCVVELWIVADFLSHRFEKRFSDPWIYRGVYLGAGILLYCTNIKGRPFLNLGVWAGMALILGILFGHKLKNRCNIVIQLLLFIILLGICESMGSFIMVGLSKLLQQGGYHHSNFLFYVIGGLIFTVASYRFILSKTLQKERTKYVDRAQYLIYLVIVLFSLVNVIMLLPPDETFSLDIQGRAVLGNAVILLLLNLYISNLIGYLSENHALRMKIALLNQQSSLQEEHFVALDKRYETALTVLHDIKKHIQVINHLYQQQEGEKAISYTQDISGMLTPLLPSRFVSDHILNTILNDKVTLGGEEGIQFEIDTENISLDFMAQIDITTLFGNLLDNAVNACSGFNGEKKISFSMKERNNILFLRTVNKTDEKILWDNRGFPVSKKGEGHGLGLENVKNVVEKYKGDISFEKNGEEFICNVSLMMTI